MFSLFSSFDNFNYFMFGSMTSLMMFILFCFFFLYSKMLLTLSIIWSFMHDFFLSISVNKSKSSSLILLSFFFFFFFVNFSSIFPYIFSMSGHMYFLLPFSLSLWIMINFYSISKSLSSFLIHMVPMGTPFYLVFFMVLVEFISNLIRPVTLSVRLMANIFSGHLLLLLLYKLVNLFTLTGFLFFFFYTLLSTVELFVSLIQSYIFCTLVYLYYSDIY